MTPDVIILSSQVSYTNKLKEYLISSGVESVSVVDSLPLVCDDCDSCSGRVIVAHGNRLRYSDLLSATKRGNSVGVCPRARFILTYDGCSPEGDCGFAGCAKCVKGKEDFEYILSLVREEILIGFCKEQDGAAYAARDTLDGLGFNRAHKGYNYILTALQLPDGEMITKDIYPDIAKKNKTTAYAVERSIRSAVSAAWSRGGFRRFNRYIGWNSTKCPTNSELLAAIGAKTKLVLGQAGENNLKYHATIDF